MTDHISAFIDHMRGLGIGPADPAEIIDDDKPRRYRLADDKPKVRNGSYCLRVEPDGFAFGWCLSFKEGVTHKWHAKQTGKKLTKEDRDAFKKRAKEAQAARDAKIKEEAEAAARKAERLWQRAGKGSTDYLKRKRIDLHGARVGRDLVIVPMRKEGALVGLQFIAPDGSKRFLKGCAKDGSYHSIARKGDDLSRIVICEGFATGGSIRQALGCPVIVAFDAGNIKPVALAIRAKYPDAKIIIGADSDQWTTRQDGTPWNPGIEKAQQAAVAIGGARVVAPIVDPDHPQRPTDWNDIHCIDGLDALRDAFNAAPQVIPDEMPEPDYEPYVPDDVAGHIDPLDAIRPLGHNRGEYYFFPRASGQIVGLSATSMGRIQNLYMLAPRDFWQAHYGGTDISDSKLCAFASAHLMDACHARGIFQPESTRGVGAWIDGGRLVVNCGDVVVCDGEAHNPAEFKGEAVYESGPRVVDLDCEPLSNREAVKLREICRMLNWKRGMYADLLAGWLVCAPVGSALPWRPHIGVTGRSGAGKSTVLDEIIEAVLGDIAIRRDGGTTEAGVRKALGSSGRPYILDEAESETQADRVQMERIIFLARRSSSGGVVENFTSTFQARSCFCFSGINLRIEQNADKGRITQLELMQDVSIDRDARFDRLLQAIHETINPEYSKRLLKRTVSLMPTLLENIRTFSLAASGILGNKRAGDQIGPMLAGAYSLTSSKVISFADARDWMQGQDWEWTSPGDDDSDAHKLVTWIMTSRVRYDIGGMSRESTIGEMIGQAADIHATGHDAAVQGLKPYGVKLQGDRVLIANQSPQMRKLLNDTPWIPWMRTLGDLPGAEVGGKAAYFANGLTSRYMSIPLSAVTGPKEDAWDEIPIEDEGF